MPENTLQELLSLPLCEKVRLLEPRDRQFIISQIDALLKARQPDVLSPPVPPPKAS